VNIKDVLTAVNAVRISCRFNFRRKAGLSSCQKIHIKFPVAAIRPVLTLQSTSAILEAVGEFLEMQMVLSVGRNFNPGDLGPIPSNSIVVRIAPQIELLKRAALCITHAGLNTALEASAQGVPMVAIPVGYDQPGVAARIAYHGVGEFVEIRNLTARRLSELIVKVKANPNYRDKARWFQKVLGETRGLDIAADIIERVFEGHLEDKEAVAATSFSSRDTNR
jgi:UDP:flavonoid glycosyltransferase YjiC (YdhE family)